MTIIDQGVIVGGTGPGDPVTNMTVNAIDFRDGSVALRVGPGLDAAKVFATENVIVGNDEFGALDAGSDPVDAERNWWRAQTGPELDADKPGRTVGEDNQVSDRVDFRSWLTQVP